MERRAPEINQAGQEGAGLQAPRLPKAIIHRDQVHGDVTYDPLAVSLLNTKTLQRLGKVLQLGYAHLVFRGGTHTRLSHVMGAAHMAGKMVDALKSNYKQRRAARPRHVAEPSDFLPVKDSSNLDQRWEALRYLVVWAALLHDVGHVPIGHTLEDEFDGIYKKHDDFASPRASHLWREGGEIFMHLTDEALMPRALKDLKISGRRVWQTVMLICFYKDIKPDEAENFHDFPTYLEHRLVILGQEIASCADEKQKAAEQGQPTEAVRLEAKLDSLNREKIFISVLTTALSQTPEVFQPYMVDIVGNTICADYLDYLRRDPLNVGLDVLRDDRILSNFYVSIEPRAEPKRYRMALALVDRHGKPRFDVCTGVIEQVRQRFRFAESIYYHKTKVSASAMFAKAIGLIGKLDEIGGDEIDLSIGNSNFKDLAGKLLSGTESVDALRSGCLPSALLHTGMGDETLHYLLMQRAFENIQNALCNHAAEFAQADDARGQGVPSPILNIEDQLRGVALLSGITQRRLYKVCISINSEQFGELTKGVRTEVAIEDRLNAMLMRLRKNDKLRARIEREMASAANWPLESVLLYAPPRKSQAKGVETFAFDKDGVVRLNDHPVVMEKVAELGRDYKNLWRLLVLVHPDLRDRHIELSRITDVLVEELWSNFSSESLDDLNPNIETVRDIAWFSYIRPEKREAARKMELFFTDPIRGLIGEVDWDLFERAPLTTTMSQSTLAVKEYADRAYVLQVSRDKLLETFDSVEEAERQAISQLYQRYPQTEVKIGPTTLPGLTLTGPDLYASEGSSLTDDQMSTLLRARELNALAEEISTSAIRGTKRPTTPGGSGGGRKRQITKRA